MRSFHIPSRDLQVHQHHMRYRSKPEFPRIFGKPVFHPLAVPSSDNDDISDTYVLIAEHTADNTLMLEKQRRSVPSEWTAIHSSHRAPAW